MKEIDIVGISREGWSHATKIAVDKAHETLDNIKSGYVQDHITVLKPDGTTEFKVNIKVIYSR